MSKRRDFMFLKTLVFAILTGLVMTFGASAQVKLPEPKTNLTTEQKMLPFAMGMSLAVLQERFEPNYYEVVVSLQKQIGYYSAELKPVIDLKDETNEYIRRETVGKAITALRAKSARSDAWQMMAGDFFGTIFTQIKNAADKKTVLDPNDLKFAVEMIGKMGENAPADIPWNIGARFKEFGKLAETEDFSKPETTKLLIERVQNILQTISK